MELKPSPDRLNCFRQIVAHIGDIDSVEDFVSWLPHEQETDISAFLWNVWNEWLEEANVTIQQDEALLKKFGGFPNYRYRFYVGSKFPPLDLEKMLTHWIVHANPPMQCAECDIEKLTKLLVELHGDGKFSFKMPPKSPDGLRDDRRHGVDEEIITLIRSDNIDTEVLRQVVRGIRIGLGKKRAPEIIRTSERLYDALEEAFVRAKSRAVVRALLELYDLLR